MLNKKNNARMGLYGPFTYESKGNFGFLKKLQKLQCGGKCLYIVDF
jgi:hypothetical protein